MLGHTGLEVVSKLGFSLVDPGFLEPVSRFILAAPHSHSGDGYASPEQWSKKSSRLASRLPIAR